MSAKGPSTVHTQHLLRDGSSRDVLSTDARDEGGDEFRFSYVDGATSRQADCHIITPTIDESNDEFSDESEVGYSSKHT